MSRISEKLIVICGPTGAGKTKLARELCKIFNGEVVNADSRSVYQGMVIGTSSPTEKERKGIPHHLFNFLKPDQEFSLVQYQKLAQQKIKEIWEKGKIPFLVGGTGLYLDSVVYNYKIPKGGPNRELRKRLEKENSDKLFKKLQKLDPETASIIDKNNKRRLVRALEVYFLTGKPISRQKSKQKLKDDVLYLGIDLPRGKLYKKIDERTEAMIKRGLVEEVKKLANPSTSLRVGADPFDNTQGHPELKSMDERSRSAKKYSSTLSSMSAVGYQEIGDYLCRRITLKKAIEKIKYRSHALARRQLTWFRKNKDIKWLITESEAKKLIKKFLKIPRWPSG